MVGSGTRAALVGLLLAALGVFGCKSGDAGGCRTDIECKGDRICRDGQCADPAPVTGAPKDSHRAADAPRADLRDTAPPEPDKAQECKALVEVMNAGGRSINEASRAVAESPMASRSYASLADASEKVAGQIAGVKLQVPELTRMVSDYLNIMRDFAKVTRETGRAVEQGDAARMVDRASAMEKVGKREAAIVAAVNRFCQPP
jgi:hypothetical protein